MSGFHRYVALGDSSTEGLEDPDGDGGYRGWADRFAEHLAAVYPDLQYANLAVRGRSAGEIVATQLARAVAMQPDLATVVAGMNDLLRTGWDARRVAGQVGEMVGALRAIGATVVTFTIPDVSARMRLGRTLTAKTAALNMELRRMAAQTGALLLDLDAYALAHDPRMWAADRIHGNPAGHARIGAALAHLVGLPGAEVDPLAETLPPEPRRKRDLLVEDVAWAWRYLGPWAWRRLHGRTTGDGAAEKRPALAPVKKR